MLFPVALRWARSWLELPRPEAYINIGIGTVDPFVLL